MEKEKRLDWVDAAKGLGIFLIVVSHAIRPDMRQAHAAWRIIYDVIIAFSIGMFLTLSGVTYQLGDSRRTAEPGRFLQKRARSLLLPFFVYALIIYGVFSFAVWFPPTAGVFRGSEYGYLPLGEYLRLTLWEDSPYSAHLWFIWALFWITLAVYGADRISERWKLPRQGVRWCVAAAFCLAGSLEWQSSVVHRVLTHTVYFVYGTELARRPGLLKRGEAGAWTAFLLSAGVLVWYVSEGWYVVPWRGTVLWQFCWLGVRLVLIGGIFRLTQRLHSAAWLTRLGRESFWVYLLHQPFCCGFVGLLLYSKLGLPAALVCAVSVALGLSLPLWAVWLGRRALSRLRHKKQALPG